MGNPYDFKPPARPSEKTCEHKFVHLETIKKKQQYIANTGGSYSPWERTDRFFCEKCLEVVEKTKEGYEREQPNWF